MFLLSSETSIFVLTEDNGNITPALAVQIEASNTQL